MKISYRIMAVLLGLVLALGFELYRTHQQLQASRADASLVAALRDSVRYSRDAEGRVVAERRALEADFRQVQAHAAELSSNQRALLHDVAVLPRVRRKAVTSATSVQQFVRIQATDSLPNRLSVITYRGEDRELHVQVTNSNPVFRTQDVDTIVPPERRKKHVVLKVLALLAAVALGAAAH